MQLTSYMSRPRLSALLASAATAGTLVLCGVTFGTSIGEIRLVEVLGGSLLFSAIVFFSLVLGGRRGLLVLWVLAATFWMALLYSEFGAAGWMFAQAVRMLPDLFVAWSILAVPLAVGTVVFLHDPELKSSISSELTLTGSVIWLILLTASAYLARHAPDVGNNPRDQPLFWGMSVLLVPFALMATLTFIWKVSRVTKQTH